MTDQTPSKGSGLDPNVAALLCYICSPITGVVFLLIDSANKQVKLHAWQSIIFGVAIFVLSIVQQVVGIVLFNISLMLAGLFSLMFMLVWLGVLALWFLMMYKAFQGSILELPVLTDIARKQAEK